MSSFLCVLSLNLHNIKIYTTLCRCEKQDEKPEQTLTEKWIAGLREEREQAIREGRYFDGQERDNILSFDKRRDGKYFDTSPCEYEP